MAETSYYSPAASPRSNGGPETPGPVLVAVAGPAAQRRVTVAFRLILAVPHFIVLYALGIAASVVVIIGWFGALATGRLPDFAAAYLSGYLRWYCRTAAYLLLLTDEYPPFALDDTAYPVRVAVGHGRLGRLAVLFRVILAIPAAIASMLLVYGVLTIVILIAWLTALVAGKLPASLHQAFAAVLRYIIRYYCYLYLLTDAYPAGLFGDQPGSQAPAEPLPDGPGYVTPGGPGYGAPNPGFGPSAAGYGGPGYGGARLRRARLRRARLRHARIRRARWPVRDARPWLRDARLRLRCTGSRAVRLRHTAGPRLRRGGGRRPRAGRELAARPPARREARGAADPRAWACWPCSARASRSAPRSTRP